MNEIGQMPLSFVGYAKDYNSGDLADFVPTLHTSCAGLVRVLCGFAQIKLSW
jgi:hypothetical protein